MTKVTVIGCGAWAMTISKILAENQHQVLVWCHRDALAEDINQNHQQSKVLPGVILPNGVKATTNLKKAIEYSRYCVFGLASSFLSVVDDMVPYYTADKLMLSLTKGILKDEDGLFVSALLKRKLNAPLAVLSGPNIAIEIANRLPAATVIASTDHRVSKKFQKLLSNSRFRVYTSKDPIGVEIGGMLKNIIAIAAGCIDGLTLGNNAKATLISRGIKEMVRFGKLYRARVKTFYGLSGLGDLVTTCMSNRSRNWQVGHGLTKGQSLAEILNHLNAVAEGVKTTAVVYELAKKKEIDMPIVNQVFSLLYENKSPEEALNALMSRKLKAEK